jgi:rhodanese-related sulfurtransferase
MAITKGIKQLCDEAMAEIETLSVEEAYEASQRDDTLLVDIRDIRELDRDGRVPGATHAPRGMLEFWVDPESPYYKERFNGEKKLIFFCAGGLRSALATKTVRDMGLTNVAHIEGGFGAWQKAGKPVDAPEKAPGED